MGEIPVVPNLYRRIWDDITANARQLDQSLFGPDSDPGTNLCKTPMCIAGHTVNLAGQAGYDLIGEFGFAIAAKLIHEASCPGVPAPRYDSYPNDWALAYIEEQAKKNDV